MIVDRSKYTPTMGPIILENTYKDEVLVLKAGDIETVKNVMNSTGVVFSSNGMVNGVIQEELLPENADKVTILEVIHIGVVGTIDAVRVMFNGKKYITSVMSFV